MGDADNTPARDAAFSRQALVDVYFPDHRQPLQRLIRQQQSIAAAEKELDGRLKHLGKPER